MYTIIDSSHFNVDNLPYDAPRIKFNVEDNNTSDNNLREVDVYPIIVKGSQSPAFNTIFNMINSWYNSDAYAIRLDSNKQPVNFYYYGD